MIDMLERKAKKPENVVKYARLIAEKEHPEWTEEQVVAAINTQEYIDKAMFQLTSSDFRRWIYAVEYYESVAYEYCMDEAKYLLENMPSELMVNVNEWMDGLPLSDIKVHGVSINDIMNMFTKARGITFIRALRCMTLWKKHNYFDDDFCWEFFALM